jgi:hypothetical protein
MARVFVEQGKIAEAQEQVIAALQLDPAHAAAVAMRAELDARQATR